MYEEGISKGVKNDCFWGMKSDKSLTENYNILLNIFDL